jgi:hypothetical protein
MNYISDNVRGPKARTNERFSPDAWNGIAALVEAMCEKGALGLDFPENCTDVGRGATPIGTDNRAFANALKAEISDLIWPLAKVFGSGEDEYGGRVPDPLTVLDLVQFCYRHIAQPVQGAYHDHYQHHHLAFDQAAGREAFRDDVNRILARNGMAFELEHDGSVARLAPPMLREAFSEAMFRSGDHTLDQMLEEARRKFLNPDSMVRREGLERLWDAWERLKSMEDPLNKKASVKRLLDKAASEPKFRKILDSEAHALTDIGNDYHIRHSELDRIPITDPQHIDYLFHRLFCLVLLLLRKKTT